MISIIAAIGKNRELGKDNKLLWHIPEDLKRFRRLTSGHPIIMGRKTFESIGRVLPNRLNIVITRNSSFAKGHLAKKIVVAGSLEEAIKVAKQSLNYPQIKIPSPSSQRWRSSSLKEGEHQGEIFIIGGGQVFGQALRLADRLYLTIIDASFDADAFFPDYSMFTNVVEEKLGKSSEYSFKFLTLEK